ncbi:unnamed protein product [Rangifer tarandus platyrhynchus]|uniref:Uncharacterized protein n=2 Tax=Rangifer tarandus platyrhynchus TaxID=3082113 RepID=A0ABN8Y3R1_RANTA|nr:unnamed protein product [Rangifer tarandus platyrhynchus]CAI9692697.1 unnamed protein product [Rangifer tarandus platyrhynchus]
MENTRVPGTSQDDTMQLLAVPTDTRLGWEQSETDGKDLLEESWQKELGGRHQPPRDKHDLSHHKIAVCLTAPLYKRRVLPLTPRRTAGVHSMGTGHLLRQPPDSIHRAAAGNTAHLRIICSDHTQQGPGHFHLYPDQGRSLQSRLKGKQMAYSKRVNENNEAESINKGEGNIQKNQQEVVEHRGANNSKRSVTAKLNKPQNHPEACLKYRPLGPNLGLLVWDVEGQDLGSCTVKQAPQGFRSADGSMNRAGSLSTNALQGRACTPQAPGCVVLWRSPLHTIYFQIHLRALAESVQITLDAISPQLSAS